MANIVAHLIQSIRSAARHNSQVQVAPACILWPDHGRQWEAVIARLQEELPELLILGDYCPEKRTGPAIWLRCVVARKIDEVKLPSGRPLIIYLPGISRQDLRAVESCPDHLKPLAELQYRGAMWSQINSKDWTILMFLRSDQGGLGLDVAQDNETKNAIQIALYRLLDEDIDLLRGKRLDKDYFNTLLTGDPVRDLLQWLDQGEDFKEKRGDNEWRAFVEVCKSQLGFSPEDEGTISGAAKLAAHEGPWKPVWERFCEAPKRYPNIPTLIREKCKPPKGKLFWHTGESFVEGWPQWNEEQEDKLRKDLEILNSLPAHEARKKIEDLEKQHGPRRLLVWAELGHASLAQALEHLFVLALATASPLAVGTLDELAAAYRNSGWTADDAVIRSIAAVKKTDDFEAVKNAIRAVYLPWVEESARYLQRTVEGSGYPGGCTSTSKARSLSPHEEGVCILFADGLRFDVAKRLKEQLINRGCQVEERMSWAALPTVTATGKPAVAPIRDKIGGEVGTKFEPCIAESGQSLSGYYLKKLLKDAGWDILDASCSGIGKGNAWCEFGDIDREGHDRGCKLATHIEEILSDIQDRVLQLLRAGWQSVHIVTDHGWLLMPGGLPKIELPSELTQVKWGRCASIKPGATTAERQFPWYWNPEQYFALADGISCYRSGEEYDHGGLSLQECLTLELIVSSASSSASGTKINLKIDWRGLRCKVAIKGGLPGLSIDIREQPGNPTTTLVKGGKPLHENQEVSLVVENFDLEGANATIVVLDKKGNLVAQLDTVIGGES
ncbi:MAG TPA: BREX-1 system phosphatase PglZ type B [Methanothrix sp.]|nr:BREX-1 system phosphatase PglZ type B [Methanothrix sp.]